MNSRAVLQERYPAANLAVYFEFIEMCREFEPEPKKGLTQEHHICPKKQFPEYRYEPENIITLYTPLHTHAHRLLGSAVPELSRANAAWIAGASKAGRKGGRKGGLKGGRKCQATHKKNGTGFYSREMQAKRGRKGGPIAARKCKQNGTGIFAPGMKAKGGRASQATHKKNGTGCYSREFALKGGPIGMHVRWHVKRGIVNPNCSLCDKAVTQ